MKLQHSSTGAPPVRRAAYLVSQYPGLSHTFIEREVRALRARGIEIHTFSIRGAAGDDALGRINADAARQTFILFPSAATLLTDQLRLLFASPARYLRGLLRCQRESTPGLAARIRSFAYFFEAARLAAELRRRDIRHVHVHMGNNGAMVAMLACEFDPALTYSITIHGSAEFFDISLLRITAKVRDALFVRCISEYCRSQVMAWTRPEQWDRIHVVHCGLDPAEFPPIPPPVQGPCRFMAVGRLDPIKGYPLLLQACTDLTRRGIEWTLELVGSGPADSALHALVAKLGIKSRVRFTGPICSEQLSAAYDRADVLVISSFMEGLPVALMEAMAKGLIVVSTNVAGIPELVEHGSSGFLVPPGSARALADTLAHAARNRDQLDNMRRAARAKVVEDFNIADTSRQIDGLLQRYLKWPAVVLVAAAAPLVATAKVPIADFIDTCVELPRITAALEDEGVASRGPKKAF